MIQVDYPIVYRAAIKHLNKWTLSDRDLKDKAFTLLPAFLIKLSK